MITGCFNIGRLLGIDPLTCCAFWSGMYLPKAIATRKMSLVRSDLVQRLAAEHPDLSAGDIEKLVTSFFDTIARQLADGGRVEIRGFGFFTTRSREARTGRNPRTGEPVPVSPKRVPFFKPSKELRLMIDESAV
jgi:integration host factor subunit beta